MKDPLKNAHNQSQHCIQSCTQFHWFPDFFLKKIVDLLVKVLGRWPVDRDYFRRLRGLFDSTFCAYFFANFLKKIFIGSWVLFLCFLLYFLFS